MLLQLLNTAIFNICPPLQIIGGWNWNQQGAGNSGVVLGPACPLTGDILGDPAIPQQRCSQSSPGRPPLSAGLGGRWQPVPAPHCGDTGPSYWDGPHSRTGHSHTECRAAKRKRFISMQWHTAPSLQ